MKPTPPFSLSQVQPWDVYRIPNVEQMEPPKPKFVVVVDTAATYCRGLVINSDYPPFVRDFRTDLKSSYAVILLAEHNFLSWDSFVDCTGIYTFTQMDLAVSRYVGRVTANCAQAVQDAVVCSDTIKPKTQNMITGLALP